MRPWDSGVTNLHDNWLENAQCTTYISADQLPKKLLVRDVGLSSCHLTAMIPSHRKNCLPRLNGTMGLTCLDYGNVANRRSFNRQPSLVSHVSRAQAHTPAFNTVSYSFRRSDILTKVLFHCPAVKNRLLSSSPTGVIELTEGCRKNTARHLSVQLL